MTGRPVLYGTLDLGGTKLRALVADPEGSVLGEEIRLSHAGEGVEVVVGRMVGALEVALAQAGVGVADLKAVGVASPGAVDVVRGWCPARRSCPAGTMCRCGRS